MRSKRIIGIIMISDEVSTAGHFNWRARPLLGIFLNEVGNLTDVFNDEDKGKFNKMMYEAFMLATRDEPQLHGSNGETMAAFIATVEFECLAPLTKMAKLDPWRTAERYLVFGVAEHGRCKLLVYN